MAISSIQVLSRAIALLRALRQNDGAMTLGQLAIQIDLPKSTVQRLVSTLVDEGLVRPAKRTRGFRLGLGFYALNVQRDEDVRALLHPMLQDISARTGETVDLAVYKNQEIVFIDQVPGKQRLRAISAVGERFPLTTTANGQAILRLLPLGERQLVYAREAAASSKIAALNLSFAEQRKPWIGEDHENKDAGICALGLGFKFFDIGYFAISIVCPSNRFDDKRKDMVKNLNWTAAALKKYGVL